MLLDDVPPTYHDHVGSMVREPAKCWCTGCGTVWTLWEVPAKDDLSRPVWFWRLDGRVVPDEEEPW